MKLQAITPTEKSFSLKNGKSVKSVRQLAQALSVMNPESFNQHVTPDRNDFADWIEEVYHAKELAQQLRETHSKKDMAVCLQHALQEEKQGVHLSNQMHMGRHEFALGVVVGIIAGSVMAVLW
jgi:2-keto-4-pentenoate hydratase/2-oxohepta-3-ene-1,7-dioic acid hydratase in catechol pathway